MNNKSKYLCSCHEAILSTYEEHEIHEIVVIRKMGHKWHIKRVKQDKHWSAQASVFVTEFRHSIQILIKRVMVNEAFHFYGASFFYTDSLFKIRPCP